MSAILLNKVNTAKEDWQKAEIIALKSMYYQHGIYNNYAKLLREKYPMYKEKPAMQRVHRVWNLQKMDAEILTHLTDVLHGYIN